MPRTRTSSLGAASKFRTGTYVGNGAATQAIIGVGFQPKCVIIYHQVDVNTFNPSYKADAGVDGLNACVAAYAAGQMSYGPDAIISLDVDGFTVGDGTPWGLNFLNILGRTYTYIAFG